MSSKGTESLDTMDLILGEKKDRIRRS